MLVVEPFTRPMEKPGCVVEAVMKARHITRRADGTLLARQLACNTCLEGEDRVCLTCTALPPSYFEVEDQPSATRVSHGTVASNSTWVRMLGESRGEYRPLPPWALVPLQPGSPFDLGTVGEDEAKLAAYNVALCTRLGW